MTSPLLSDVKVLEIGHFIAGPFATRVLADLGAEVIKVEPPGAGDPIRSWGERVDGHSLWWSVHARNKRCITLNLRHPDACEILLELVAKVDCVVENQKVGQLDKWGLTLEAMNAVRPGITVVRVTGFGQTGPEARRAGWGVIGEAKGGLRYLCGYPEGTTDLPPVRTGVSMGDSIAGLYAALGAVSAILQARSTGRKEPCVVDVALGEAVLTFMEGIVPEYSYLEKIRQPSGSSLPTAAPSNAHRAKDGAWVLVAANSNALFKGLAQVMGQPELATDPRFADNIMRVANQKELDALVDAWVGKLTADEVVGMLEAADIPTSKIYTAADIAADAQYRAREMLSPVADPLFPQPVTHPGVVPVVAGLDRPSQIRWPGPEVGAHNDEIYGTLLGRSAAEIAAMQKDGII